MVGSAKDDAPKKRKSPSFLREEIILLLNLVEKYKLIVLNKSTNAVANQAKDVAWAKIAKEFNESNLKHSRSANTLKIKWDNLKKLVKKSSRNILDSDGCELDEIDSQIIALMSAAEGIGCIDNPHDILEEDMDQINMNDNGSDLAKDVESEERESDDNNEKSSRIRAQNFSPQESKLLLQCVRKEKKHVFCKEITSRAIEVKNQAWSRIADNYNKLSPQKRSTKCLRMKFTSMKKLARKLGSTEVPLKHIGKRAKHEELINDSFENIKKEPLFEEKMDEESDQYSDHDDDYKDDLDTRDSLATVPPDPLSSVLNGDSGIGSSSSNMAPWNWNQPDNKEIVKLQKELLTYQMETAKMERKRIEEAMLEEAREREARATERALRLRAARLDAVAAAARLAPAHPALSYPPEEARALQYLSQYQQS